MVLVNAITFKITYICHVGTISRHFTSIYTLHTTQIKCFPNILVIFELHLPDVSVFISGPEETAFVNFYFLSC